MKQQLTKAEEQVMQILWRVGEGVVKDVVNGFKDPKPAYTTVATVLKVLESKDFVMHRKIGNTYLYAPKVQKKEYAKNQFSSLLKNYFNNSFPQMASFFAKENNLDMEDMEAILKQISDHDKQNKK
jgi:predicted transcriptional regulator